MGVPRLDDLLRGGLSDRSQLVLLGPPFLGKEVVAYSFLAEGLKRGDSIVIVTTGRSPPEVAQEIGMIAPQFRAYEQMGRVHWIDASNPVAVPSQDDSGRALNAVVKGPADFTGILTSLSAATRPSDGRSNRCRVALLELSTCLTQGDPKASFGFLHNMVTILKQRNAVGLYGIDAGTLPDPDVSQALARMDGAIEFKQDHGKTVLAVRGAGEVATRDWIEYRATNRTLSVGSFALERIR